MADNVSGEEITLAVVNAAQVPRSESETTIATATPPPGAGDDAELLAGSTSSSPVKQSRSAPVSLSATPLTATPASALMNAVHEELRSLASQLTSPEPDVRQIRQLHSILSDALQRQSNESSSTSIAASRALAKNLASVAATHCVRMMTSNGLPSPVASGPVVKGHLHVENSLSTTPVAVASTSLTVRPSPASDGKVPSKAPVRTNTGGRIPHGTIASEEAQSMYLKSDPMLARVEHVNEASEKTTVWRYRCRQCLVFFDHRRELKLTSQSIAR